MFWMYVYAHAHTHARYADQLVRELCRSNSTNYQGWHGGCREIAPIWSTRGQSLSNSLQPDKRRSSHNQIRAKLMTFDRISVGFGRTLVDSGPILAKRCQTLIDSAHIRSMSGNMRPSRSKFGPNLIDSMQHLADFGPPLKQILSQALHEFGRCRPDPVQVRPNLGRKPRV